MYRYALHPGSHCCSPPGMPRQSPQLQRVATSRRKSAGGRGASGDGPVEVTVRNMYDAAAIKIIKVVQGATLPPDTQLVAQVQ